MTIASADQFGTSQGELVRWKNRAHWLGCVVRKVSQNRYITLKNGIKRGQWNAKDGGIVRAHHEDLPTLGSGDPRLPFGLSGFIGSISGG